MESLKDIIWAQPAVDTLRRLVDENRLPHAMLLTGPSGNAKLLIAEMLAQYIHCENPVDGKPCGKCPACIQHKSFNNADLIYSFPVAKKDKYDRSADFMDQWRSFRSDAPFAAYTAWQEALKEDKKNTLIYVAEAADIIRRLNMSNLSAKYKILILWLPERLQEAAANKMLKIIEEPFADTKIIFVSEQPELILPTILSRLQRFVIPRIDQQSLAKALQQEFALDHEAAEETARLSSGDINKALQLIASGSEIEEFRNHFQSLMRLAYSRDVKSMYEWSETFGGVNREKIVRFLTYLAETLRENYIFNLNTPLLNNMAKQDQKFSVNFARFVNDRNIEAMIDQINSAAIDISGNTNAKIVLFDLCLNILINIRK